MNKRCFLFLALCLLLCGCGDRRADERGGSETLLTIDGEEVPVKEGLLYLTLMRQVFEEKGGTEIWDMHLAGRDAGQSANERALESLIRAKILSRQTASASLDEGDRRRIERGTVHLLTLLGEDRLKELSVSEEELKSYMEESYRAYRYRQSMVFLPGSRENELQELVDEEFAEYTTINQDDYLQKVKMDAIMIYTGEWMDGSWISYPLSQQEEKLALAEKAKKYLAEGYSFALVRGIYSEDEELLDTPLLRDKAVVSQRGDYLYRGQIQTDLAERIFRTPAGEYTDIITTRYGYILVYVEEFQPVYGIDYVDFKKQLQEAREEYRIDQMQVLSEEQFEAEYERLKAASAIEINEEVWSRAISMVE